MLDAGKLSISLHYIDVSVSNLSVYICLYIYLQFYVVGIINTIVLMFSFKQTLKRSAKQTTLFSDAIFACVKKK